MPICSRRNNIDRIINAVLLRITVVAMYVMAFRTLPAIKQGLSLAQANPSVLLQICGTIEHKKALHNSSVRSFFIILLSIIILLPIFKTLTIEISTDTIWFNFALCQVIYCVGSVRSTLLQNMRPLKEYERKSVIPLEESLLISKNISASREAPSIASVVGFILVFSRLENNFDVVYLQTIGFILYFFLPAYMEYRRGCLSNSWTAAVVACAVAASFLLDRTLCMLYAGATAAAYLALRSLAAVLE
ncbi:hypothetical protein PAPHI01_2167 [Pancytospora philotis]|nr:hypothetical protein PAPHI01_2167 [Pancytospora philotis]